MSDMYAACDVIGRSEVATRECGDRQRQAQCIMHDIYTTMGRRVAVDVARILLEWQLGVCPTAEQRIREILSPHPHIRFRFDLLVEESIWTDVDATPSQTYRAACTAQF